MEDFLEGVDNEFTRNILEQIVIDISVNETIEPLEELLNALQEIPQARDLLNHYLPEN